MLLNCVAKPNHILSKISEEFVIDLTFMPEYHFHSKNCRFHFSVYCIAFFFLVLKIIGVCE